METVHKNSQIIILTIIVFHNNIKLYSGFYIHCDSYTKKVFREISLGPFVYYDLDRIQDSMPDLLSHVSDANCVGPKLTKYYKGNSFIVLAHHNTGGGGGAHGKVPFNLVF